MDSGASLLLLGTLYGFILWIVTLVPIHKPITGFSPFNHPLGHMPALLRIGGHIIMALFLVLRYLPLCRIINDMHWTRSLGVDV